MTAKGSRGNTVGLRRRRKTQSTIAPNSRGTVAEMEAGEAEVARAARVKVTGLTARSTTAAHCSQQVIVRKGYMVRDSILTTGKATLMPIPTQTSSNSTTHDLTAAAVTVTLTISREATHVWLHPQLMFLTMPLHPLRHMQAA